MLISATTKALLGGAGLPITSRGIHQQKGIDSPFELFVVGPGEPSDT